MNRQHALSVSSREHLADVCAASSAQLGIGPAQGSLRRDAPSGVQVSAL